MTAATTSLKGATLVDFTGTVQRFKQLPAYGDEFVALLRSQHKPTAMVVIDAAVGADLDQPVLVADHLNVTGSSPLLGPNHPSGERFPVVQGIYVDDELPGLARVITAGLKHGIKPSLAELQLLQSFGATVCTYNMVPSMIVCAHARIKLLGIILPAGRSLPADLLAEILKLTGESQ